MKKIKRRNVAPRKAVKVNKVDKSIKLEVGAKESTVQISRKNGGNFFVVLLIGFLLTAILFKAGQVIWQKGRANLKEQIYAEQMAHFNRMKKYAEQLKAENVFLQNNFFAESQTKPSTQKLSKQERQLKIVEIQKSLNQIGKIAEQIRREFVYYDNDLSVHLLKMKSQELEEQIYLAWIVPELTDRLVRNVERELYSKGKDEELIKKLAEESFLNLERELDKILVNDNE